MNFLGYKSVKNIMCYIQLKQALFRGDSDKFVRRVAKNAEEAKALENVNKHPINIKKWSKSYKKRPG